MKSQAANVIDLEAYRQKKMRAVERPTEAQVSPDRVAMFVPVWICWVPVWTPLVP